MDSLMNGSAILESYPYLSEKVSVYRYPRACFIVDARNFAAAPFAKQQCDINRSAALFLEKCDGRHKLNVLMETFGLEMGYGAKEKQSILDFVHHSFAKGHLIMGGQPIFKKISVFSDQGSSYGFPAHLCIELTNNCNLKCRHCYGANYKKGSFVDTNLLMERLRRLTEKGAVVVELTGGEPLLHPDFSEILQFCIDNFLLVALISNGTKFTDEIIEIIATNKEKVVISISLDGPDAKIHDAIRGKQGTFDKATSTIKKLRQNDIKVRLATVISKHNYRHIYDIAKLGQDLQVNWIAQSYVIPVGDGKNQENLLRIEELQESLRSSKNAANDFHEYYLELDETAVQEVKKGNCGSGWRSVTISPTGNLKLCVMADENQFSLGNIFEDELEDIFSRSIIDYFCKMKAPDDEDCKDCIHLAFCKYCLVRPLEVMEKMGDKCSWNQRHKYLETLQNYSRQFVSKED